MVSHSWRLFLQLFGAPICLLSGIRDGCPYLGGLKCVSSIVKSISYVIEVGHSSEGLLLEVPLYYNNIIASRLKLHNYYGIIILLYV